MQNIYTEWGAKQSRCYYKLKNLYALHFIQEDCSVLALKPF